MKKKLSDFLPYILTLYIVAIFVDSLRYKFTDHPNTQVIFGKLDIWAGTLGFPGAFAHSGIFSQYVIGSAELLASVLLLLGLIPALRKLSALGAALALAIMSGAIFFHLFTPLGIDPNNDGGGLFLAAVILWCAALALLVMRRKEFLPVR